ncbi:MAG: hypothetical protein DWI57_07680 [Chloroflexi bacterium]|nr:MAG: hypothetical protein DWI57_07680 [Chloroflexota bacterium]
MKTFTIAEAKENLYTLVYEQGNDAVLIVENGQPLAILSLVTDPDDMERLKMAYSPELQAILANSRQQIREGKGIPAEEFWRLVESDFADEAVDSA